MALLEAFIATPVQIFFALRIWRRRSPQLPNVSCLSHAYLVSEASVQGKFVTIVIIILSILHCGFSVGQYAVTETKKLTISRCSFFYQVHATSTILVAASKHPVGQYHGILPCSDCRCTYRNVCRLFALDAKK